MNAAELLQTHYLDRHPRAGRGYILDLLVSDLWRQHPVWPITISACDNDSCPNQARGGALCRECLRGCLAELVGPELAAEYCGAVATCTRVRHTMMDRVREVGS